MIPGALALEQRGLRARESSQDSQVLGTQRALHAGQDRHGPSDKAKLRRFGGRCVVPLPLGNLTPPGSCQIALMGEQTPRDEANRWRSTSSCRHRPAAKTYLDQATDMPAV
jgi:hypothetical protein